MRTRRRILLVALAGLVLAAAAAVVAYLQSRGFEELARAALERRASAATGLQCRVRSLRFDVLRLRFEIRGFELAPAPGRPHPIELAVDEIEGRLRLLSLWRFKVDLAEVHARRPRLRVAVGRDGEAFDPEKIMQGLNVSLDLAAGKVTIDGGWLDFNDRRIPVDLVLRDALCEVSYRARPRGYAVHLAYRDGSAVWSGRPLTYDLDTRLLVTLDGVEIDSYDFREGESRLRGAGSLVGWRSPVLRLRAAGKLAAQEIALFAPALTGARGDGEVTADLLWDASGLHALGKLARGRCRYRGATIDELAASFEIDGGRLRILKARGRLGPGKFEADGELVLVDSTPARHRFKLTGWEIRLRDVAKLVEVPGLELDNAIDSTGEVSWRRGLEDLEFEGSVRLSRAQTAGDSTALEGEAEIRYSKGSWVIPSADLRSRETEIHASGHSAERFHVQIRTSRLGEPLRLARNFVPQLGNLLERYPDLLDAAGSYELDGDVIVEAGGRVSYEGNLLIRGGRFRSYGVEALTAAASWNGSELELHRLEVRRGAERVEGDLALTVPREDGAIEQMSFQGSVAGLSLATLKELGFDFGVDAAGTLRGRGKFGLEDGSWSGAGDVALERGKFHGEEFDSLQARVELEGGRMRLTQGQARRRSAGASFRGEVQLETRALDLAVNLAGLSLGDIPGLAENKVEGTVTASAQILGTTEKPRAKGTFELEGLRYASWQVGRGRGSLDLEDGVVQGSLSVQSELGAIRVQGRISTDPGWPGAAEIEFKDWNLQRLATGSLPAFLSELSTALEGRVKIEGPFADAAKLTAKGEMDGARFKIHDYELRNSGKIRFTLSGRKLRVEEVNLAGEGSSLTLAGEIPVDQGAGLNLQLGGTLNLRFLEHLEKKLRVSGSTRLDVRATGPTSSPQVVGIAALNNTRFDYGELPFHLSGMHGNVVFSRNLVRLDNVEGSVASGTIRLTGTLEHDNAEIRSVSIQASAHNVRATYPRDLRSTADAELNLRGSIDALVLTGEVDILRSEYVRDFNLLEQLAARSTTAQGPQVTDPKLASVALNVSIHSDGGLFIDNELTKLRGRMGLTLRGTPAYPSLTGRIEATEGSIFFRGNRFEIIHAAADFVDRNRINPVVDIRAESDVKSYRLLLDVSGNLDNLRFNVSSDPPLSTVDIVSLLTTGKSFEGTRESSRRQAEITGLSAASILSESLTGVIGKRVQRLFGFESFRVDPFLAGAENDPTARVTISERISKELTVTFSRNLSTTEEQIVLVEYDQNKNLSIIATRDEDGKFGVDFRFRKRLR